MARKAQRSHAGLSFVSASPGNPTTGNGEAHTHIKNPSTTDQFEFIHSGIVSWDGKKLAVMDETGGGGTAECDGSVTEDSTGLADSWSTYWYNGRAYANGGLNRRGATGNRGLDVFTVDLPGLGKAKKWASSNPQTQEASQVP